jgi:hypothetical protein
MDIFTKSVTNQLVKTYTEEKTQTYDVKFLNSQKIRLETELAEVNKLLNEAVKLNIKGETVINVAPEDIVVPEKI